MLVHNIQEDTLLMRDIISHNIRPQGIILIMMMRSKRVRSSMIQVKTNRNSRKLSLRLVLIQFKMEIILIKMNLQKETRKENMRVENLLKRKMKKKNINKKGQAAKNPVTAIMKRVRICFQ